MIWLLNPPYKTPFIREGRCQQKKGLLQSHYPPLTLATIGGILRDSFEIKILDCIATPIDYKKLASMYDKDSPDKVIVNSSTPTIASDMKIAQKLFKRKKAEFYFLGVHAKYFAKEINKIKGLRAVTKLPEEFACELAKKKFSMKKTAVPAWDLININKYRLPLKNEPFLIVQTGTGCPYSCNFCTAPFYYGKKTEYKQIRNIIKEIKFIKSLGISNILFFSENFTLNKKLLRELCKEIIRQKINISWICNSRPDTIQKDDITLMKKAGCWLIGLGVESGDQNILDQNQKRIKLQTIQKTVNNIAQADILCLGHFIIGLPGETRDSIQKTIEFSKKLKLDFALFNIATPFPGSALYEQYKKYQKYQTKNNWAEFEYSKQVLSSKIDLEKWQKTAQRKFYLNIKQISKIFRIVRILGLKNSFRILYSGIKLVKEL